MHWSRKRALLRRESRIRRIEDRWAVRNESIERSRALLRCEALLVRVAAELSGDREAVGAFAETIGVREPGCAWLAAAPTGDTVILFPEGW